MLTSRSTSILVFLLLSYYERVSLNKFIVLLFDIYILIFFIIVLFKILSVN